MPVPKKTEEESIQVVLAVYDPKGTYARHAGVLITSIFRHTSSPVHVTILHDATLTHDNRSRLSKTSDRFCQTISFIDVSDRISRLEVDPDEITRNFSRGSLYRLLIPELLNVKKAIYLDCDIAVNTDIAELWSICVDDVSLAAVRDSVIYAKRKKMHNRLRRWIMRHDAAKYFNSGVLLMNLGRIRQKHDLMGEAVRFLNRYRNCADFPDQDFLNMLFRDDAILIDKRFNTIDNSHEITDKILHLTGKYKPWTVHQCTPRDYFYWRMFAESEWRDQLVDATLEVYKNNPVSHYHTSDCVKRILIRWKKDVLSSNIFIKIARDVMICATEFRCRISGNRR